MTAIATEVLAAKLVTFVDELFFAVCEDLVPPTVKVTGQLTLIICPPDRGFRTRTGSVDDNVLRDSEETSWLKGVLQVVADRAPREKVCDLTCPKLVTKFGKAARAASVASVPHQLRHSGPSRDQITGIRLLESIQTAAAATPIGARRYHDPCVTVLEAVVRGQLACPLPPQR